MSRPQAHRCDASLLDPTRERGFSLLEVLVAVAIFAVIGAIAYSGLAGVTRTRERLTIANARLREVALAIHLLESDLGQAANRPIRGPFGEAQQALIGTSNTLELTHYDWSSASDPGAAAMARSAYALGNGGLVRQHWSVLDRAPGTAGSPRRLARDISVLALRYRDSAGRWSNQWPSTESSRQGTREPLPTAVEVALESADFGRLRRVIEVPRGSTEGAP